MKSTVLKLKKINRKIDLNREFIRLDFNWISTMVIATFYVYGFFGYGVANFKRENISIHIIIILYVFSLLFLILNRSNFHIFNDVISFKYKDLILFIYFFSLISISARSYLSEYQSEDELSYIGTAFQIPIKILDIINFVPATYKTNHLTHVISFLLLASNVVFIKKILKNSLKNQLLIICITTIMLHIVLSLSGVNLLGYSKLNTLPYFVFGSIFGINPLVFRLTTIFLISLTLTLVCKFLSNTFKLSAVYWLIVFSIYIYTPIELFHSIVVEQSIFYFIFGIIPLIEMFFRKISTPRRFIPLLIVGVYFRSTVLLILLLYIVFYFFINKGKRKINRDLSPIILLLPYIYGLIISPIGSKGTDLHISLQEILDILSNSLNLSFGLIVILISGIGFVSLAVTSIRTFGLAFFYTLFSLFLFYIYLSADLIGAPKYQQEWFSPIYVLGLIFITGTFFTKLKLKRQIQYITCALTLLFFSLLSFYKVPLINTSSKVVVSQKQNFSLDNNSVYLTYSFTPYPYSKAFEYTRKTYGSQTCLNVGVVYNLFPEIFSGVNLNEYRFLENQRTIFLEAQLINGSDWTSVGANELIAAKVSCVLLSSSQSKKKDIDALVQDNWVIKKIFWHSTFPSSVVVMEFKHAG